MKPILYEKGETLFRSNGLGRLQSCIECTVTEERNGIFEADFVVPVGSPHFDEIIPGRSIAVTHDDSGTVQPFDIVAASEPIDGKVTFHAVHVSYRLTGIVCRAKNINTLDGAMRAMVETAQPSSEMGLFTLSADFSRNGYCAAFDGIPRSVRQVMGGVEGSILDTYGGEWEFNGFAATLHKARGQKRDFAIRYGVNLSDYQRESNYQGTYTSCIPYWSGGDGGVVVVGQKVDSYLDAFDGRDTCIPLDLSDKFEEKPSLAQLQNLAYQMMQTGQVNLPAQTINVDFVRLQDFEGYGGYEDLLQCHLCDSVDVIFPRYGIRGSFKIVKTVWDVLEGRYKEMELGNLQTSLAEALGISDGTQGRVVDGRVYVNSDDEVEVLGDLNITGALEGLYKVTTCAVTVGAINAHRNEAGTDRPMTAVTGYHAVGIVGWSSTNFRISPATNYVHSDTAIYAGFKNVSATDVAAGTTVTFRVLWLKATPAS